ncbi:MAG: hypothetical protein JSW39_26875 [Desulfobacterales bacterium]|nr:MAG: hypothetical protein JSW39_26875 [Desulfobacterales bacterium]
MIEPLETSVERIPSDAGLGPHSVVLVVPAAEGTRTADLYRRFSGASANCRAREAVVAIVSTGVLNTPDRVRATGRRRDGNRFEMNLEIRRFEGSIRANDSWIALVRMEFGSLEPGTYQLVVQATVLRFVDLHHPERATNPTTSEQHLSFSCI